MVATLVGLLVSHTGLLEQIDVNEATSQFSHVVEVDPDELTEPEIELIEYDISNQGKITKTNWKVCMVLNIYKFYYFFTNFTWRSCRS